MQRAEEIGSVQKLGVRHEGAGIQPSRHRSSRGRGGGQRQASRDALMVYFKQKNQNFWPFSVNFQSNNGKNFKNFQLFFAFFGRICALCEFWPFFYLF